jgi:hypothetical protein
VSNEFIVCIRNTTVFKLIPFFVPSRIYLLVCLVQCNPWEYIKIYVISCDFFRHLEEHSAHVKVEREKFRKDWQRDKKKNLLRYPPNLKELGFQEWLRENIQAARRRNESIDDAILALCNGCPSIAKSYKGMELRGQQFRTQEAEKRNQTTTNSIILCEFTMKHKTNAADRSPMSVSDDYVGIIEYILEIDFLYIKPVLVLCKWFGATQKRPYSSMKIDEYGFSLFDCTKHISETTKYGNPCVEPSRIRHAYICHVDNDPNWIIVVESIPHHSGPMRRNIPRLTGPALNCDMERELTVPRAQKSGGKYITYSMKPKPIPGTTSAIDTIGRALRSINEDESINVNEEEDEEEDLMEKADFVWEGDEQLIIEEDDYTAQVEDQDADQDRGTNEEDIQWSVEVFGQDASTSNMS